MVWAKGARGKMGRATACRATVLKSLVVTFMFISCTGSSLSRREVLENSFDILEQNEYDLSRCFDEINLLDPDNDGAIFATMAFIMQKRDQTGLTDVIISLINAASALRPDDTNLRLELVRAHLKRLEVADIVEAQRIAEETLLHGNLKSREKRILLIYVADCLRMQRKLDAALEHYILASISHKSSKLACPTLLNFANTILDVLKEKSEIGHRQYRVLKDSVSPTCMKNADTLHALSRIESSHSNGNDNEALRLLDGALLIAPDSAELQMDRSQLLRKLGRYGEAQSVLKKLENYSNENGNV